MNIILNTLYYTKLVEKCLSSQHKRQVQIFGAKANVN